MMTTRSKHNVYDNCNPRITILRVPDPKKMVTLLINDKILASGTELQARQFQVKPGKNKGFYLYQTTPDGDTYLSYSGQQFSYQPWSPAAILFTPHLPSMDDIQIRSSDRVELKFENYRLVVYMSIPGKVTSLNILIVWIAGILLALSLAYLIWKIVRVEKDEHSAGRKQRAFTISSNQSSVI